MTSLFTYVSVFFFFKQKTAYEMRISDWSSDVCSSDLGLAGAAIGIAIGDCAGADDRSRSQIAGLGEMRNEGAEIERHVLAGIRTTERLSIEVHPQRTVQLAILPALAQFVGGDEHRRQRRGGFGLEEPEADRKRTRLNSRP